MKQCLTCNSSYEDSFSHCPRDGMSLVALLLWTNGSVIRDKYRIIGPAGAGGMASVYKAEHIAFKELRALKVMNAEIAGDENSIKRFVQEALLTRQLDHPNAVRVHDIERDDQGRPFIAMEFITGGSLRDAMQSGPLPQDQVIRIAGQVASALAAAHRLGIVHRDIKPANILLAQTPEGEQAKVVDFGIARVLRGQQDSPLLTLTNPGCVIGSPAYLSPEQAAGNTDEEIDGRSDLYSLGVVLYQLLSGDLPLNASTSSEFLFAHIYTQPEPLHLRCPNVPRPLADLVMSCLSKNREDRPPNAKAFIDRLQDRGTVIETLTPTESRVKPAPQPQVVPNHAPTAVRPQREPPSEPVPVAAPDRTDVKAAVFEAAAWFGVLFLVEFLAERGGATSLIPWLVCAIGLAAVSWARLFWRRPLNKQRVILVLAGWLVAGAAASLFAFFAGSQIQNIWSTLVESMDVSMATVHRLLIAASAFVCVVVGSVASLKATEKPGQRLSPASQLKALAGFCAVYVVLVVAGILLTTGMPLVIPVVALAGGLAQFTKSLLLKPSL